MSGQVTFEKTTPSGIPSSSVWKGCTFEALNNEGCGFYMNKQYIGDKAVLPDQDEVSTNSTYAQTPAGASNPARSMRIAVGGTAANDNAALFTQPLGSIAFLSDRILFFETEVNPVTLGNIALFAGFTNDLSAGLIANGPATTGVAALSDNSHVGFVTRMAGSALASIDAVYKKGSTKTTVKENVYAFTANTPVKLGVVFDGKKRVRYYVNGEVVAIAELDDNFPVGDEFASAVAAKTGAVAGVNVDVRFNRVAVETSKTG